MSRHRRVSGLVALLLLAVSPTGAGGAPLPGVREGLDLPAARVARPVLLAPPGTAVDVPALRARVGPLLGDNDLGRHRGFIVYDLSNDRALWTVGQDRSYIPASTTKLFTALAALETIPADTRFATKVLQSATSSAPVPRLVLVGGGDPLLAGEEPAPASGTLPRPATLSALVRETVRALRAEGTRRVSIGYDASLFAGPAVNPTWERDYIPGDVVSPISALWVDQGLGPAETGERVPDPALSAAQQFGAALAAQGIRVVGSPVAVIAGEADTELARVESPALAQIVQYVLEVSDNEGAEVLLRHVALATGRTASFLGGAAAVREVLAGLGVPQDGVVLYDGSGLSRANRVTLAALVEIFRRSADPERSLLRGVVTDLPVAGFTGSLAYRFTEPASAAGRGVARAKTGTLSGVHALAGTTVDVDGTELAFVAIADRVPLRDTLDAREQLDRIVATLTVCGCAASP